MFGEDKFDEAESAGVARVGIAHDGCILDFTIFAKDFSEVFFLDLLSEASDEKVGAFVVLIATRLGLAVARRMLVCVPYSSCSNALTGSHHLVGGRLVKRCGCGPRWCHGRGEVSGIAHAARTRGCLLL